MRALKGSNSARSCGVRDIGALGGAVSLTANNTRQFSRFLLKRFASSRNIHD
jgi:hypothetical protein